MSLSVLLNGPCLQPLARNNRSWWLKRTNPSHEARRILFDRVPRCLRPREFRQPRNSRTRGWRITREDTVVGLIPKRNRQSRVATWGRTWWKRYGRSAGSAVFSVTLYLVPFNWGICDKRETIPDIGILYPYPRIDFSFNLEPCGVPLNIADTEL